jgi:hypothetical protein
MREIMTSKLFTGFLGMALLTTGLVGCSKSATGAPPVVPSTALASGPTAAAPQANAVALDVARTFMTALLTKGSTSWRGVTSLPLAWDQRCELLMNWPAVASRVDAQRPPAGAVRLSDVRWAKRPADTDESAQADAWRVLSDIRTSCGNAAADATLAKLHGYDHVLVQVTLATPEGPHPVMLRLSRIAGDWRVTGLRSS